MAVMMWMQSPNILPLERMPQLSLSRCVALLGPQRPLGVPPPLLYLLTKTLLPHREEERNTGRRQKIKEEEPGSAGFQHPWQWFFNDSWTLQIPGHCCPHCNFDCVHDQPNKNSGLPYLLEPYCSPFHRSFIPDVFLTLYLWLIYSEILSPGLYLIQGEQHNTNGTGGHWV